MEPALASPARSTTGVEARPNGGGAYLSGARHTDLLSNGREVVYNHPTGAHDRALRRVIRIMDIDGKVNPADALTKHLDKSTWLGYISRMYNRDMSAIPTSIAQPRSSKGGV